MDVSSVNSGSSSYAVNTRQTTEAAQPREPRKVEEQPQQQAQEGAKPVVNAQGQTTGTLVNTTA